MLRADGVDAREPACTEAKRFDRETLPGPHRRLQWTDRGRRCWDRGSRRRGSQSRPTQPDACQGSSSLTAAADAGMEYSTATCSAPTVLTRGSLPAQTQSDSIERLYLARIDGFSGQTAGADVGIGALDVAAANRVQPSQMRAKAPAR